MHERHTQRVEKGRLGSNPDLLQLQKEKHISDLNRVAEKATEENPLLNHIIESQHTEEQRKTYLDDKAKEVFDFWQLRLNKVNAKFSKARKQKVFARLNEGYSVEQIKQAILGCKASPRHQGDNGRGQKLDELSIICANRIQLERFIEIANLAADYRPRPFDMFGERRNHKLEKMLQEVIDTERAFESYGP